MVDEGYKEFSRANTICGAPSVDRRAIVVVSPHQLKSIYELPESSVDAHWVQSETIQAKYTVGDPEIFSHAFHVNVIRNQITRNLDALTGDIVEEIGVGFNKHWGTDEENWTTVPAWTSCLQIVAKAVNRIFVGNPHCRNEEFLNATKRHAEWVFSNAFLIHSVPWFIRPIVGNIIWLYGKMVRSRCLEPMLPLIKERLAQFLQQQRSPCAENQPPFALERWPTMVHQEAYKTGNEKYLDPIRVGHRLLILNFVAMHTTSFTLANALQDIFSQDPKMEIVQDLREECSRVLAEAGGIWTLDAVSKLHRTHSAIRESMRVSSFSILALPRRVVAEDGITIENAVHIPKDIYLATPMDAIHLDPTFYADPQNFHPFRFCRPASVEDTCRSRFYEAKGMDATMPLSNSDNAHSKAKPTVSLDDKFLSFGLGRNACPGRFFALHEIKLMLAHIVLHYDIAYFDKRPEQLRIMWVQLPRVETQLRVGRRAREQIEMDGRSRVGEF